MIFGMDVSHPAPGSFAPSIATVVGTMDRQFALYGNSIRVQPHRVEVIETLTPMVMDLLRQFNKTNKTPPTRVSRRGAGDAPSSHSLSSQLIFFRD